MQIHCILCFHGIVRGDCPFDAGVFIASCDKGMPVHLTVGRINIPSIVVTGGLPKADRLHW